MRNLLLLFATILVLANALEAQNQVLVTVSISPPFSHRFSDYAQYRTQTFLSLTNTTQQDLQMKVLCEISGQGTGFFLKTRLDYVPNQVITLAPGETRQFNGGSLTGYLDRNNTESNIPDDVETEILRTGLLPQDIYDYCIEVVEINTLEVLGRKCTVIPIQYLSPPQPNIPWCGETHDILSNPNINFSWLPATGGAMVNANLRYDFFLIPVPAGQDPGQLLELAMDGQLPGPFFNWPDIMGSNFLYNSIQYGPLAQGQYVWGVVARDLNGQVGIENNGRSQFCTLTLGKLDVDPDGVPDQADGSNYLANCSCQAPSQAPGGPEANELLQVGTDIKVGAYDMRILTKTGNRNGTGKISMPGFPGGVSLPILVDFTDISINGDRKMISGNVKAQLKEDAGFLPKLADPDISTLPLGSDQVNQLDQYFVNNKDHLISSMGNALDASGFQLPLGLDKEIGGQQVVVAITGLYFDATRAALDAAVVLNLVDAGTKIALSGRTICLKDGLGLCGEAELYLAEDLEVSALNMSLRGLKQAGNPNKSTRVLFDKDGFKRLHIEAIYQFPKQTLEKLQGNEKVTATLMADTEKGWSDWVASVSMDAFRITGVSDFGFHPGTSFYDHSSKSNPENMPADYVEGQSPTWTGFFLQAMQVDLPPIIRNRNTNQPLSASANNVIIDGNGLTGSLNLNNVLALGDGGNGNWQFSVDKFTVKFLKSTFQSGGFEGRLLLPITNRGVQSQLNYSSLLSYANNQFSYNFVVQPKSDLEVDLFALLFELYNTSTIAVSYNAQNGFIAAANLDGKFSINTNKFSSELPDCQLAHLEFTDFELSTNHPYVKYGHVNAGLASPPKSVGGFPFSINEWKIVTDGNGIGLQADVNLKLSEVGFLPNAATTIAFYGGFDQNGPKFNKFALKKVHVDGDFSILHIVGDLEFFYKDAKWGDGFSGNVSAKFPPEITLESRMQVGNKNGQNYWYVDGQSDFNGKGKGFLSGLNAFGFSGGAYYNMAPDNFQVKGNITSSEDPGNFTSPGQAPSGTSYVFQQGSFGIKASVVLGLVTKSLFNSNAAMEVTINPADGGVKLFRFDGAARMFGEPGTDGLAKGTLGVKYDFPNKILVLGVGFGLDLPALPVKAQGWLGIYSNGTNGDWHFKVGRPLGYGTDNERVKASIDAWAIKVTAIAYFQCGNYDVDGLPKQLPPLMSQIFPNYRSEYAKNEAFSRNGADGNAILIGLSVGFTYRATYLIIYGQFDAETGFDLLLKNGVSCNGVAAGIDGWYGTGQFYIGMAVSMGISIDLFFISGEFEILKIGFGGLLRGGGPNPTWMEGQVGGFYSILGGLVEGHAKLKFAVGQKCIDASDVLSKIKIFNDTAPETIAPDDPMVKDSQSVLTSPTASTNLRINRTFSLEQTLPNGETQLRVFRLDQNDISAEFTELSGKPVDHAVQFSEDEFGVFLNQSSTLSKKTWYKVKFMANLSECPSADVVSVGQDKNGQPNGYCSSNNWQQAKIKDKNTGQSSVFKETREIRFVTNAGLDSIPPEYVIYTIPHRGQRFFCHWDVAQVVVALKKQIPAESFKAPDGVVPVVKMRFVPSGMSDDAALPAGDVTLMSLPYDDPALAVKNVFGNYVATKGKYYYLGQMPGGLLSPNTTYGIQYYLEWPKPPAGNGNGQLNQMNVVGTAVLKHMLTDTQGVVNLRALNSKKYLLGKNQHQIYRYYFRTSQYPAFYKKVEELAVKEMIVKELLWGSSKQVPRKTISILSPEVENPAQIIARIKAEFSPAHWGGNDAKKGLYIRGVNFDGPENFDVFDVKGFQSNYVDGNQPNTVKVLPLISMDNSLTRDWWRNYLFQTLMIMGYNGVKEGVTYDRIPGWTFAEPTMTINRVAGPITENAALGSSGPPPSSLNNLLYPIGQLNGIQHFYNNSLVEISRFVLDASLDLPGVINSKNQILGGIIKNKWISDPTPVNEDQWNSKIGAAYDHLGNAGGPGFKIETAGTGLGGVKVNAIQTPGAQIRNLNLGKKR